MKPACHPSTRVRVKEGFVVAKSHTREDEPLANGERMSSQHSRFCNSSWPCEWKRICFEAATSLFFFFL